MSTLPAFWAEIDVGHTGVLLRKGGGRTGKMAVSFFKWRLKDDQISKDLFCGPVVGPSLTADGWKIKSKNGFCS
jgi:hypothetical protein